MHRVKIIYVLFLGMLTIVKIIYIYIKYKIVYRVKIICKGGVRV
jgi:hypothetical protein